MPPKPVSKDRAWGTRYDTLDLSPPVSPFPANISTATVVHARKQSPNLSTDSQGGLGEGNPHTLSDTTFKTEKMPHDASVFVGR